MVTRLAQVPTGPGALLTVLEDLCTALALLSSAVSPTFRLSHLLCPSALAGPDLVWDWDPWAPALPIQLGRPVYKGG